MEIKIPDNANKILSQIENNGHTAYVVGGCVRDSLMGREPHDWDICTSATPDEVLRIFKNRRVSTVGIEHGTVVILIGNEEYEVTTYRIDGEYSDNRRPDKVEYTSSLVNDLSRRDFTINALAYNERTGLVDPFNGYKHIKEKKLKCVGNPEKRFTEDALRILRLYRFQAQLGFEIEENTEKASKSMLDNIDNLSKERVQSELCKLICGDYFFDVMKNNSDIVCKIIPELNDCVGFNQNNKYHIYDIYEHTLVAMKNSVNDKIVRLALLLHDIGKPKACELGDDGYYHYHGHGKISRDISENILNRLRFDNKTKNIILVLVEEHDRTISCTEKSIKRLLNKLGEQAVRLLLEVRIGDIKGHNPEFNEVAIENNKTQRELLDKIITDNQCFGLKDLSINGKDLINLGFKEGKEIGDVLNGLLNLVIDNELENSKDKLLEKAKSLKRVL